MITVILFSLHPARTGPCIRFRNVSCLASVSTAAARSGTVPLVDTSCPCHVCQAEDPHDPWCSVHLADHEHLEHPPRDCGLREGVRRTPELTPVVVYGCSTDPPVVLGSSPWAA